MSNTITSIEILEDGKLLAYCDKERIYIQPVIEVDTLKKTKTLQLHGSRLTRVTIDETIESINGVAVDFTADFEGLETAIRELAREANSVNNTKTHGKKFSLSTDFTVHEFPTAQVEYMVYVIRVKKDGVRVNIKGVSISVQSDSNDDFQLKSSIGKKFTYTVLDSDFSEITPDSKLELAQPGVHAVPTNPTKPTASGFFTGGREVKAKFGTKSTEIELVDTAPIELIEGVTYEITAMGRTGGAKLDLAFNWEEC